MIIRWIATVGLLLFLRPSALQADPPATQPATEMNAKLDQRLGIVNFEDKNLRDVLLEISRQCNLNLIVSRSTFEPGEAPVDWDKKLHGQVTGLTVRNTIAAAVQEWTGSDHPCRLTLDTQRNVVLVGDGSAVETRVFHVGKILQSLQEDLAKRPKTANNIDERDADMASETLASTIMDHVGRGTWRDEGGMYGTMTLMGNSLIITQFRENLDEIDKLLKSMEAGRAK